MLLMAVLYLLNKSLKRNTRYYTGLSPQQLEPSEFVDQLPRYIHDTSTITVSCDRFDFEGNKLEYEDGDEEFVQLF